MARHQLESDQKEKSNENRLVGWSFAGDDDIAARGCVGNSYTGGRVHTDGGAGN
jgi:hypothetical protein